MRILGLIMITAGITLAVGFWYLIRVGEFPANLYVTCGFWSIIAILGFFIFGGATNKNKDS